MYGPVPGGSAFFLSSASVEVDRKAASRNAGKPRPNSALRRMKRLLFPSESTDDEPQTRSGLQFLVESRGRKVPSAVRRNRAKNKHPFTLPGRCGQWWIDLGIKRCALIRTTAQLGTCGKARAQALLQFRKCLNNCRQTSLIGI